MNIQINEDGVMRTNIYVLLSFYLNILLFKGILIKFWSVHALTDWIMHFGEFSHKNNKVQMYMRCK